MTETQNNGRSGRPLKGPSQHGRRLSLHQSYRLMTHIDSQRNRIEGKLTYEEVTAEVVARLGFPVLRGNVVGACRDLGVKCKPNRSGPVPTASKKELLALVAGLEERVRRLEQELGVRPAADTGGN
jgi:hypothetical protein